MMKTVLVTGANRGLGLEFVRQYLQLGWRVVACCRKPDIADELNLLKKNFSGKLAIYSLDISDYAQIEVLADRSEIPPIDLLISNAGVYGSRRKNFGDLDYVNWMETFKINCMAGIKLVESFIEHVVSGNDKKIIFISSLMGSIDDNNSGGSYIYRSTKAALNSVVKSLSRDLRAQGISVASVHPGWVLTDMGGPNALITPQESINGMRNVISDLNLESSGSFVNYDGRILNW